MQLKLTNQSALEISQWLSDKANPQQNYPSVAASRAALRVRKALETAVKDYSNTFKELVDKDQEALKAAQVKLQEWKDGFAKEDKAPSQEAETEFVKVLQSEFEVTRKEYQDLAVAHEEENGKTPVQIELTGKFPEKDWKVVKEFFEANGQRFPMWALGDKLEAIAQMFDEN